MADLIKPLKKKINHTINTLIVSGVLMLLLGVMIVWTDFMLRLVMGLIVIAIAYVLFYGAYRLSTFMKDIEKFLKF